MLSLEVSLSVGAINAQFPQGGLQQMLGEQAEGGSSAINGLHPPHTHSMPFQQIYLKIFTASFPPTQACHTTSQ